MRESSFMSTWIITPVDEGELFHEHLDNNPCWWGRALSWALDYNPCWWGRALSGALVRDPGIITDSVPSNEGKNLITMIKRRWNCHRRELRSRISGESLGSMRLKTVLLLVVMLGAEMDSTFFSCTCARVRLGKWFLLFWSGFTSPNRSKYVSMSQGRIPAPKSGFFLRVSMIADSWVRR